MSKAAESTGSYCWCEKSPSWHCESPSFLWGFRRYHRYTDNHRYVWLCLLGFRASLPSTTMVTAQILTPSRREIWKFWHLIDTAKNRHLKTNLTQFFPFLQPPTTKKSFGKIWRLGRCYCCLVERLDVFYKPGASHDWVARGRTTKVPWGCIWDQISFTCNSRFLSESWSMKVDHPNNIMAPLSLMAPPSRFHWLVKLFKSHWISCFKSRVLYQ